MIQHQDGCILLFVKYPQKGAVKLRLSKDLDEDIVIELYRCFVQDTLTTIKKIDVPLFICFHPPDAQRKFQSWLGSTHLFLPQRGNDLGERMKNCFTEVFKNGFQTAVLLGSDSPDIPEEYLKQAFIILQNREVVLGPTVDGGYYLIGFRTTTFTSGVFDKIHWSSPLVFEETMTRLKQAHRSVGLLPIWNDIDTISDLNTLIRRTTDTLFKSSNTMTCIRHHRIQAENDHEEKSGTKSV